MQWCKLTWKVSWPSILIQWQRSWTQSQEENQKKIEAEIDSLKKELTMMKRDFINCKHEMTARMGVSETRGCRGTLVLNGPGLEAYKDASSVCLKQLVRWAFKVIFRIVRTSWFQNCPWLIKNWQRYWQLKRRLPFLNYLTKVFDLKMEAFSLTVNFSTNSWSNLLTNDSFGILRTSWFRNCP